MYDIVSSAFGRIEKARWFILLKNEPVTLLRLTTELRKALSNFELAKEGKLTVKLKPVETPEDIDFINIHELVEHSVQATRCDEQSGKEPTEDDY